MYLAPAPENERTIGYRLGDYEDVCLECVENLTLSDKLITQPITGEITIDDNGKAYLYDSDGCYGFAECVSCLWCDTILMGDEE